MAKENANAEKEREAQRAKGRSEEIAAIKRKLANTTDDAKRAELNARLARHGVDPNDDSLLGNPVPERQSPPKATADASPDMDVNRAAAKVPGRKLGARKPMPIGVESDKLPGDQEMYNFETGEWSADKNPGIQEMHTFEDAKPEKESDVATDRDEAEDHGAKDEAKPKSRPARKDKAEAAKPAEKPAAKPAAKKTDPKKRDADPKDDNSKDDEVHVSGDLKVSDAKKDDKPEDVSGSGGITLPKSDSKG